MSSHSLSQTTAFLPGMIVRFPVSEPTDTGPNPVCTSLDEDQTDFRDFHIGRIERVSLESATATISAFVYDLQESRTSREVAAVATTCTCERRLDQITRCRVLPDSPFHCAGDPAIAGSVLAPCTDGLQGGVYLDYYVEIGGQTRRLSEAEIVVGSTRQDPDPVEQALRYELQNPCWRVPRDRVVEAYGELRSVTFGIEDLVGSRVFLLPHQAKVITRVLSGPEYRYMLADEVGLGKTIEASVIFKALRHRKPGMRALIIAPASLTHQWRNELNNKLWLDLPIVRPQEGHNGADEHVPTISAEDLAQHIHKRPGAIVSAEDLAEHGVCWSELRQRRWDLLIVDEAHHLRKTPALYKRICQLSEATERVLILTATPIQRRASEYLALLRVLDPRRYRAETEESFGRLLEAQRPVRAAITIARPLIGRDDVDVEELIEELAPLAGHLGDDATLAALLADLSALEEDPRAAHDVARQIVAYVGTNYRIESRVIRNRRKSDEIELPQRVVDTGYSYTPTSLEGQVLDDLYGYAEGYLSAAGATPLAVEYVRSLLHAAGSSPQALCATLRWREEALRRGDSDPDDGLALLSPAAPREAEQRIRRLMAAAPAPQDDASRVARLLRQAEHWQDQAAALLAGLKLAAMERPSSTRLGECVRVIYRAVAQRTEAKALVFTGWTQTAAALVPRLRSLLGHSAVERFTADMGHDALQAAADRFQSSNECCVLVCDELGGEGRNFQIADFIVHVDIPWTPAQVEQRIGRVDRLGRTPEVLSVPIFARGTVEHDLFRLWDEGLRLFTSSMSGMEIALESTQDLLAEALGRSVRDGLASLREPMRQQADDLREEVEKERLYESETDDKDHIRHFKAVSEKYRDGSVIRSAVKQWTGIAGLSNFQIEGDTMIYEARSFKVNAMRRARFLPPNMVEAARRLGNARTTRIVGTFNRDVAVRREDLVFFAPGDDPWTDAVIMNALECDRGRCCAVGFGAESAAGGSFFELLYSFQINPRPLYERGLAPVYLLQAQSYLPRPHLRLLVALDGSLIGRRDPRWQLIERPFKASPFTHLGERKKSGRDGRSALEHFRARYPFDIWSEIVGLCIGAAERHIRDDVVDYAAVLAAEAEETFRRRVSGWEAGLAWRSRSSGAALGDPALVEAHQAADALVEGIRTPICRLESICFWDQAEEGR
jgi:ATP-dependent helicase HepA